MLEAEAISNPPGQPPASLPLFPVGDPAVSFPTFLELQHWHHCLSNFTTPLPAQYPLPPNIPWKDRPDALGVSAAGRKVRGAAQGTNVYGWMTLGKPLASFSGGLSMLSLKMGEVVRSP